MYSEMRRVHDLTVVTIHGEVTLGNGLTLVVLLLVQPDTVGQSYIILSESEHTSPEHQQ